MYNSHPIRSLEPPLAAQQSAYRPGPIEIDRLPMLLSPGRPLCVRPVTPTDTTLLADLIARLSDGARQRRFFRPLPSVELIWQEASRVTQRTPQLGAALVATASERNQVYAVALAELVHDPAAPAAAEVAVLVRDDLQRQGVGTGLLRLLIALAGQRGVRALHATLQAENRAAQRLLGKLGLAYRTEMRYGELSMWAELP